jgi:hypothetical protein
MYLWNLCATSFTIFLCIVLGGWVGRQYEAKHQNKLIAECKAKLKRRRIHLEVAIHDKQQKVLKDF